MADEDNGSDTAQRSVLQHHSQMHFEGGCRINLLGHHSELQTDQYGERRVPLRCKSATELSLADYQALVKNNIISNTDGAEDCSCNEQETQWHVMGNGNLEQIPMIRQHFTDGVYCEHEPDADGVYPDWADPNFVLMTHWDAAIHWFQNGHPMKSWGKVRVCLE